MVGQANQLSVDVLGQNSFLRNRDYCVVNLPWLSDENRHTEVFYYYYLPKVPAYVVFLGSNLERILVVVSPIRHILVEPAPEADCLVAVKGILLSIAS